MQRTTKSVTIFCSGKNRAPFSCALMRALAFREYQKNMYNPEILG
jgi:hypothetical protein